MTEGELARAIRAIPTHSDEPPRESQTPIGHFKHTTAELVETLKFFSRKAVVGKTPTRKAASHLGRVRQLALVGLVESLERFFKELAAVCVDVLAPITADDRFDDFVIRGTSLVGCYTAGSIGRALADPLLWHDSKLVNERFKGLLEDTSRAVRQLDAFLLLPKQPAVEGERYETLQLVWQLRHSVVHNVGVVTETDAVKLRVLSRHRVPAPRVLVPTVHDMDYLGRFLQETATRCNGRVAERLAELLTRIHADDPTLIDPADRARYLADTFRVPVTVAGEPAAPPP